MSSRVEVSLVKEGVDVALGLTLELDDIYLVECDVRDDEDIHEHLEVLNEEPLHILPDNKLLEIFDRIDDNLVEFRVLASQGTHLPDFLRKCVDQTLEILLIFLNVEQDASHGFSLALE